MFLQTLLAWQACAAQSQFHRSRAIKACSIDPEDDNQYDLLASSILGLPSISMAVIGELRERGLCAIRDVCQLLDDDSAVNVERARALYSRAWVCFWDSESMDLEQRLQEADRRIRASAKLLQPLEDVGLAIGSRMRVFWTVKFNVKVPSSRNVLPEWRDIWWGCAIVGLAPEGESDTEGRPLWKLRYDALPSEWNDYPSEVRRSSVVSRELVHEDSMGYLAWMHEEEYFNQRELGARGLRPEAWPPGADWVLGEAEKAIMSEDYVYEPSW